MSQHTVKSLLGAGLVCGMMMAASATQAHYPWLMASSYTPNEGRSATAYIGWGHNFPFEGFLAKDRIQGVEIILPDGKRQPLEAGDGNGYTTTSLKAGTHVLLASQTGGYRTRTTEGAKREPKQGLSGIIECRFSTNSMKSILTVGNGDGPYSTSFNQPLEIIPLSNPAELKIGDYMDVQVLVRDEPYEGMVFATYGDFSSEGAYAYTVEADNEGKASIRILHTGNWLVRTTVRQPYPDPEVCDVESYTTTLTFSIR